MKTFEIYRNLNTAEFNKIIIFFYILLYKIYFKAYKTPRDFQKW